MSRCFFMEILLLGDVAGSVLLVPKRIRRAAVARLPVLDLPFGFVAADAVTFLDASEQLVALAGDDVEVVVGQLAPLLLGLALELFPVAFDGVFVHRPIS